jgi:hypothetical protein
MNGSCSKIKLMIISPATSTATVLQNLKNLMNLKSRRLSANKSISNQKKELQLSVTKARFKTYRCHPPIRSCRVLLKSKKQ